MRLRLAPVVIALAIALPGCRADPPAHADAVDAAVDRSFVLAGGQQATIGGTPLRLRFTEVLEDSRCPTEVECVWTGQARVAVAVTDAAASPTTVEFNTNPAPGQNRQTVATGDYVIELQRLDPYPRTPDDATALGDYRATLLVRNAD